MPETVTETMTPGGSFAQPAMAGTSRSRERKPGNLVIVDGVTWPGRPVASWPPAIAGVPFEPPSGRGTARLIGNIANATAICPICGRAVKWLTDGRLVAHNVSSERCPGSGGTPAAAPALAAWLPVKRGLTPRGLRHSHKTWMIEDKIPEVLAELPLGHEIPGIRGAYSSRLPNSSQWRTGYHRRCSVSLVNELLTWAFFGGRYWDRTSDLFRVREALSR
jgi:hypothetical protein